MLGGGIGIITMDKTKKTRIAYLNGDFLPESEVKVSFRDRGFVYGDAVIDAARTFNG